MRHKISLLAFAAILLASVPRPLMAGDLLDALDNPNGAAADRIRKKADSYNDPNTQARARKATSWKEAFERCMGESMADAQADVARGVNLDKTAGCNNTADRIAGDPTK